MPALRPLDAWWVQALVMLSFAFSLLPSGLDFSRIEAQGSYVEGSLSTQIQFGSLFLAGALLALRHAGWTIARLRRANPFLIVFVLWCACSVLWSPYPLVTLKKVVQLGGFFIVGLAIASPVGSPRALLRGLLAALTVLLVASLVMVLVNPTQGVDYELGAAWRGVMGQKNTLGAVAGIAALLWLRELHRPRLVPWPLALLGLGFSLLMLVMAKSSTAVLVTGIGTFVYLVLRRRGIALRRPVWVVVLGAAAVLLLASHLFYVVTGHPPGWDDLAGAVSALFNKQADLTGRTDIWALVFMEVGQHPLHGLGYGAFWLGLDSRSQYVIDALHWIPLQSHNGYLDLLNEVGAIGLTLAVLTFIWHATRIARLLKIDREEGALYAALLVTMLVSNTTESEMFRGLAFYNILFIYSALAVSSRVALHRRAEGRA